MVPQAIQKCIISCEACLEMPRIAVPHRKKISSPTKIIFFRDRKKNSGKILRFSKIGSQNLKIMILIENFDFFDFWKFEKKSSTKIRFQNFRFFWYFFWYFFSKLRIFLRYSFDVEIRDLSIYDAFKTIPALLPGIRTPFVHVNLSEVCQKPMDLLHFHTKSAESIFAKIGTKNSKISKEHEWVNFKI